MGLSIRSRWNEMVRKTSRAHGNRHLEYSQMRHHTKKGAVQEPAAGETDVGAEPEISGAAFVIYELSSSTKCFVCALGAL